MRAWLNSTGVVLLLAIGTTVLAWVENRMAPWAPFYFAYVLSVVVIPILAGRIRFGVDELREPLTWGLGLLGAIGLQVLGGLVITLLYPSLLELLGVPGGAFEDPFYSLEKALSAVYQAGGDRLGLPQPTIGLAYLVFIFLWAGLGEELFYRGYLHRALAAQRSVALAALVSAAFFALRHATQLAILWPRYPWAAAGLWVGFAFLVGLIFSAVYERSRSLAVPVVVHTFFNLIPLMGFLLTTTGP